MHQSPHCAAKYVLLVSVMGTLLSLAGCGLKGPLYRPGESKQQTGQPANTPAGKAPMSDRAPAPQSQKNDRGSTAPTEPAAVDPDRPANPAPGTP